MTEEDDLLKIKKKDSMSQLRHFSTRSWIAYTNSHKERDDPSLTWDTEMEEW